MLRTLALCFVGIATLLNKVVVNAKDATPSDRPTPEFRVYRTLVFPCGSGIGLEIADALGSLKEVRLIGATSKSIVPTHCPHIYPSVVDDLPVIGNDDNLANALLNLVRIEKVSPRTSRAFLHGLSSATLLTCALPTPSLRADRRYISWT